MSEINNKMPKWEADLMTAFLDGTKYSGSRKPKERVISASSLGKEPYYLMLEYIHGKSDEQLEYGANTTGSIYQLGIDSILKDNPRYMIAHRMKYELENGWIVSGEIDIFDKEEKIIVDAKLLSGGSYESTIKDNIDSDYNLQQASYKMLFEKVENIYDVKTALHAVNKAGSAAKKNIVKNFEIQTYDSDTIIQMLLDKTNEVQYYIDNGTMPLEICDIFKYGKTNGVANRCKLYCDYRDKCPSYNQHSHHTTNLSLNALEPTTKSSNGQTTYLPGKDYEF